MSSLKSALAFTPGPIHFGRSQLGRPLNMPQTCPSPLAILHLISPQQAFSAGLLGSNSSSKHGTVVTARSLQRAAILTLEPPIVNQALDEYLRLATTKIIACASERDWGFGLRVVCAKPRTNGQCSSRPVLQIPVVLRCRDLGPDCDAEVKGEIVDEILEQVGKHAQSAHGMEVTPELAEAARSAIEDE